MSKHQDAKDGWQQMLLTYKEQEFKNAPVTPYQYVKNSEELLLRDLKQLKKEKSICFIFKNPMEEWALLKLDRFGNIPLLYEYKFKAYQAYGAELGMKVDVLTVKEVDLAVVYVTTP